MSAASKASQQLVKQVSSKYSMSAARKACQQPVKHVSMEQSSTACQQLVKHFSSSTLLSAGRQAIFHSVKGRKRISMTSMRGYMRSRLHTSAYVGISQHTSAYASIKISMTSMRGYMRSRLALRCQHLYFCSSKARKLSTRS